MHMLRDSPTSLRNPRVHPFGVLGSDSLASLMLWYKCALVCLCCLIQICCSHWLMVESESARHISLGEELLYIPRSHCVYIYTYMFAQIARIFQMTHKHIPKNRDARTAHLVF